MKRTFAILIFVISTCFSIMAQAPPPPPPDAGASNSGPVGNGAPIGSGLGIMLAMFAAWGGKKAWEAGKITDQEDSAS
jgi:hypothetical protein